MKRCIKGGFLSTNFNAHHSNAEKRKDDWYTPPEIFTALGTFDLDPCGLNIWPTAKTIYEYSGLERDWFGRVWMNPPYNEIEQWMQKLSEHGNGIALTFARVETKWFQKYVWAKSDALLFFKKRLTFYHSTFKKAAFNAGAPSVLIAYGSDNVTALYQSKLSGTFVCGYLDLK